MAKSIDIESWRRGYRKNLEYWAQLTSHRPIHTIFFGGGTPSLMPPQLVEEILQTISQLWRVENHCEVTLEANPNTAEVERFQQLAKAGINRLSLGIQSLRSEGLRFLGREHTLDEAKIAIQNAQNNFPRFSFDLIYTRPQQSVDDWKEELSEALQMAKGHLSLYQLTIEPNTAFATRYARGDFILPDEEMSAQFYEKTDVLMEKHGYRAYEVSNYAQEGHESLHNLVYWQYGDYLGIGPGAHGRVTLGHGKYATYAYKAPQTWLDSVLDGHNGLKENVGIGSQQQQQERLLMGLRLQQGIPLSSILEHDDKNLREGLSQHYLCREGFICVDDKLSVTPKGRLVLNRVIQEITDYLL